METPRKENRLPLMIKTSGNSPKKDTERENEDLKREVGRLRSELQKLIDDRGDQLEEIHNLKVENVSLKKLIEKSSTELDSLLPKICTLEKACSSQKSEVQSLQQELKFAQKKLKEYEEQKKKVNELEDSMEDLLLQIRKLDDLRKKQHNFIMDLKGNIRVFCRVRPILPGLDRSAADGSIFSYPTPVESLEEGIELMHNAQKYSFIFNKVFNPKASQEEVFEEISEFIQSSLDGYKVCIFAYGQTGSGKTYTMMGKQDTPDKKGIIPRSLEQIFLRMKRNWKYKMQASMLEIYNETIRDLLSSICPGTPDVHGASKQHSIRKDANGNIHVSDLKVVDLESSEEASYLLRHAAQSRSVGRTQMNEQSSRSHFVFTLRISGLNEETKEQVQGVLNLIDLAGSERLDKSGSTGDRLKETQAINKSLSALSDVLSALAKKEDHIPFRNSKLTHLLQPYLGKDSKALMFVNISPEASSSAESLCSLRFADKVSKCETGIPRRQT